MYRKPPLTGRQLSVGLLWIAISGGNAVVSYLAITYYLMGRLTADTSMTGNATGEAVLIMWLVFEAALLAVVGYYVVHDHRVKRAQQRLQHQPRARKFTPLRGGENDV